MNRKILIGTLAGLALVAGSVAHAANAQGLSGSGSAQVEAHAGFGTMVRNLFDFHRDGKGGEGKYRDENHEGGKAGLEGVAQAVAVEDGVIAAKDRKGVMWTIVTDSDIEAIAVGDLISFDGTITASSDREKTLEADAVFDLKAGLKDKDHARAIGTIESVDAAAGTVVLDTKHRGDITVAIDSDTVIKDEDGDAGVFADLAVGAKAYVKGMLNSLTDVMTAVKVRIVG